MSRELKVKAFSKSEKKFTTEYGVSLAVLMTQQPLSVTQVEDLVFIQYTGLKDSNGVEIYEGDIVQVTRRDFNGVEYKDTEQVIIDHIYGLDFDMDELPEVIGNIHESPERLEVKS